MKRLIHFANLPILKDLKELKEHQQDTIMTLQWKYSVCVRFNDEFVFFTANLIIIMRLLDHF